MCGTFALTYSISGTRSFGCVRYVDHSVGQRTLRRNRIYNAVGFCLMNRC